MSDVIVKAISANSFNEGAAVIQAPRGAGTGIYHIEPPVLVTNSSGNLINHLTQRYDDPTYYTA